MTIFGWDASHYDWTRGPMDVAAAMRDGVVFMTHKIGEGFSYTDDKFDDFYARARAAGVPLLGAYYVNRRGDQADQADRFLTLLDAKAPGWRDGPFILQADCERWHRSDGSVYAYEPSAAEVRAFCDRLVARTGGRFRPLVYAPEWVYGGKLVGLPYPLWASAYGSNIVAGYRSAYPGDGSSRWGAYSGQTPAILQYGSKTKIGSQPTCDANAFRGTLAQLTALVTGQPAKMEDEMFCKRGDTGPAVQALQYGLQALGFDPGEVDGAYGAATAGAVVKMGQFVGSGMANGDDFNFVRYVQMQMAYAKRFAPAPAPQSAPVVDYDKLADALLNRVIAAGSTTPQS